MNIESIAKLESNFFFVSFISGITVFIYLLFALSNIFGVVNIIELLPIVNNDFGIITVFIISYIIGMFIHGIRYFGFMYYKKLDNKRIKKMNSLLWRKAAYKYIKKYQKQKKFKNYAKFRKYYEYKKRSIYQNVIKYLFRDGTVVEVCLTRAKEAKCSYQWIQETKKANKDVIKSMWSIASSIDKEKDVYRFYFYSEIFQCFDTTFISLLFIQFVFTVYTIINTTNNLSINEILNRLAVVLVFGIFHRLSKNIGISFGDRFLNAIDTKRSLTTAST